MDIKKQVLLISIVIGFTTSMTSQYNPSRLFYYKGKVVTGKHKPVPFAHIINVNRNFSTITDTTGNFELRTNPMDSIKISSVGFYTKYIISDSLDADSIVHVVKLKKKTYNLPEVNISEIRWQVFKSEFMEKKIEEVKEKKRISDWMSKMLPQNELQMIYQNANRKDWLYPNKYKR